MTHAYIADAVRTPRGRGNDKGSLKPVKPAELLAQTLRALAHRTALDTAQVCDAVFGCVTQTADQGASVGTLALPLAGWSDAVGAVTINRYCASGLSATHFAALQALHGDTLALGGGIEMMSRVPMGSDQGPLTHDRTLQLQAQLVPIGIAADAIATQRGYSRAMLDAYAAQSQQRAAAAAARGMPPSMVAVTAADGSTLLDRDENIRPATTAQTLAALPAAFAEWGAKGGEQGWDAQLCRRYGLAGIDHVHHAGNSPAMADAAAAVLVGSRGALERGHLAPRARILGLADTGSDRMLALTGTVDAARIALQRAGLQAGDIDLFEINEGFAAMALHFSEAMAVGQDRLNVNGGAIAIGHAMGATGAAMVSVMLDELELRQARYGCLSICGAAGVASAMVVERVSGF
jgi:acetyl-CoA C-acetyltransferase